jgi:hypothetical protein
VKTWVLHKAIEGSGESIDDIASGLIRLRDSNSLEVKVIYVDNCCSVRKKLQEIFPNALVLLDPFHWFKRFDKIMMDSKSEEAEIFRGLLRRCIFVASPAEYNRAAGVVQEKLAKKNRLPPTGPTHKQIMSEARTVIPPKETLKANVEALLHFVLMTDLSLELKKATRDPSYTSPLPQPFFKPMNAERRKLISDQLRHITKGCLSDPPGIVLHRQNALTGKTMCCRGTPSCENANLYLDLLTGKSLGIARADRLTATFLRY